MTATQGRVWFWSLVEDDTGRGLDNGQERTEELAADAAEIARGELNRHFG